MNKCPSGVPGCEGPIPPGTITRGRRALLRNLVVGDIFHASAPNGASLICLVTIVTDTTIRARTVTHQMHFEFDRETGIAEWSAAKQWPGKEGISDEPVKCVIDSVAPLPIDVHEGMLFVDRKERLVHRSGDGLSDFEKECFIFMYSYYSENSLPGAEVHERATEASPVEKCLVVFQIPDSDSSSARPLFHVKS
jgi:hypothetical protein